MNIVKSIICVLLLIPYILTFGMFTISADFPDGSEICYEGWIF